MSYEYYHNFFIAGIVFTVIFLVICIVLYFLLNVKKLITDVSGYSFKAAKKDLRQPKSKKIKEGTDAKKKIIQSQSLERKTSVQSSSIQYVFHPPTEIIDGEDTTELEEMKKTEVLHPEPQKIRQTEELIDTPASLPGTTILTNEEDDMEFIGSERFVDI